jgi:cytochrome c peroxidase
MKRTIISVALIVLTGGLSAQAIGRQPGTDPADQGGQVTNPALVELGKKLYFDPRLSKSGFISCNSCHNLSMGGTDNIKTSIGDKWQQARSTRRPC